MALTRTGYPVMVGLPGAAEEDAVDGIRYVRTLPARSAEDSGRASGGGGGRAIGLVAEFRPHVIHATTNYYNALVAQAVSAATGVPVGVGGARPDGEDMGGSRTHRRGRRAALTSEKARLVAAREGESSPSACRCGGHPQRHDGELSSSTAVSSGRPSLWCRTGSRKPSRHSQNAGRSAAAMLERRHGERVHRRRSERTRRLRGS